MRKNSFSVVSSAPSAANVAVWADLPDASDAAYVLVFAEQVGTASVAVDVFEVDSLTGVATVQPVASGGLNNVNTCGSVKISPALAAKYKIRYTPDAACTITINATYSFN